MKTTATEKTYNSNLPEIAISYKRSKEVLKVKITSSQVCYNLFQQLFNADTIQYCEEFIAVFLNRANNTIGWLKISQGGYAGTVVDVKIILGAALKAGASGIIIAHNHPSGEIVPSEADKSITAKLNQACKICDINLLDHIILGDEKYYSFSDNSLL